MTDDCAIDRDSFDRFMSALGLSPDQGPVAVAVSGGADSMALSCLAHQWGDVVTLMVDHGLRPESAAEAAQVENWLKARGIQHETLRWTGDKPQSDIQKAARTARYRLLESRCRDLGIHALLLAHHMDDQAETLLLRLARGSGLRGLSGMAGIAPPLSGGDTPLRYRPLLTVPKARLKMTCRAFGQHWIEDPGNANPAYERTMARRMLENPPLVGLTAPRLAATAKRLGRAQAALDHYVTALFHEAVKPAIADAVYIARPALLDAPEEVSLRLLSAVLMRIGGSHYPPRMTKTENILKAVKLGNFRGLTVAGCLIRPVDGEHILLCREPAACAAPVPLKAGQEVVWDNRFRVRLGSDEKPGMLGALGEKGWRWLATNWPDARAIRMPHAIKPGLPAFYREDFPVSVPHLGYGTDRCTLGLEPCHDNKTPS